MTQKILSTCPSFKRRVMRRKRGLEVKWIIPIEFQWDEFPLRKYRHIWEEMRDICWRNLGQTNQFSRCSAWINRSCPIPRPISLISLPTHSTSHHDYEIVSFPVLACCFTCKVLRAKGRGQARYILYKYNLGFLLVPQSTLHDQENCIELRVCALKI